MPFLELSLPLLSVWIESLKAWDQPTIPHRQLKLGFFFNTTQQAAARGLPAMA